MQELKSEIKDYYNKQLHPPNLKAFKQKKGRTLSANGSLL